MSTRLLTTARAVSLLILAFTTDAALARNGRNLVHKIPPLSSDRLDDLIHEFPPLRPVPGASRASVPEPPRKAWTAPTLDEAPRVAYDAPSLAELGVPPPEPVAREPVPVVVLGPEARLSPLMEIYAQEARGGSGRAASAAADLIAARRTGLDLEHFLSELPQTVRDETADAPPPATNPAPEDAPAAQSLVYLIAVAILLGVLAFVAFARRENLHAGLRALVARLRGAPASGTNDGAAPAASTLEKIVSRFRKPKEEDEAPPINLSRIERITRASARTPNRPEAARPTPADDASARELAPVAESPVSTGATPPVEDAGPGETDDLILVEPGDDVAASAAINAARARQEGPS